MTAVARRRDGISPALAASALAHAAIIAATVIAWPWLSRPMKIGNVVPVTLVTRGPPAELSQAIQAPEPAPAETPAPVPTAPPEPAPVSSAPPTPPAPSKTPKPAPAKPTPTKPSASPKPAASTASAKAAQKGLDLDALLSSLDDSAQAPSTRAASGRVGANRAQTALAAREGHGQDETMSASETAAFVSKLEKLWNPNCQVEGAAGVNVKVRIRLTPQGWLAASPELADRDSRLTSDPIWIAAAQRALSAVGRGAPYTELNPDHYASWREMIVNFNAKEACAR